MNMSPKTIELIGTPVDDGGSRRGCLMGPDMLRVAGLGDALRAFGHEVADLMFDLVMSLFGKSVIDRRTRSLRT